MTRRLPILVLLAAWWPLQAIAFDTTMPLEAIAGAAVPAAAPAPLPGPCHPVPNELAGTDACASCAVCHPPTAPAVTGGAPRRAAAPAAPAPTPRAEPERRSVRQPVERLDRPPFIRPM
jgi:hypothetical protein